MAKVLKASILLAALQSARAQGDDGEVGTCAAGDTTCEATASALLQMSAPKAKAVPVSAHLTEDDKKARKPREKVSKRTYDLKKGIKDESDLKAAMTQKSADSVAKTKGIKLKQPSESLPLCVGRDGFDVGYGPCENYDEFTGSEYEHCENDGALEECSECKACTDEAAPAFEAHETDPSGETNNVYVGTNTDIYVGGQKESAVSLAQKSDNSVAKNEGSKLKQQQPSPAGGAGETNNVYVGTNSDIYVGGGHKDSKVSLAQKSDNSVAKNEGLNLKQQQPSPAGEAGSSGETNNVYVGTNTDIYVGGNPVS